MNLKSHESDRTPGGGRMRRLSEVKRLRSASMAALGAGLMLLAVAGAVAIARLVQSEAVLSAVPVDTDFVAPPLAFSYLDGQKGSLAGYRGKVVLVNLWATWCPPCLAEIPVLESAARDNTDRGLVVLAINEGEDVDAVSRFVRRQNLEIEVVLDPREEAMRLLRTTSLPSSYLVDEFGHVRSMWFGAIDRAHLDPVLARVLNTGGVP